MHSEAITHRGVVNQVLGDTIEVEIQTSSACGHCSASDQCVSADSSTRKITVDRYLGPPLKIGDPVTLTGQKKNGLSAVLYAYFLPFVLVVVSLFVANDILENEALAGLISLLILVPYYTIIWFLKGRLKQKFSFKINI